MQTVESTVVKVWHPRIQETDMDSPSERAVIALRSRPLFDVEIKRNCTSVLEFPPEDKNVCFYCQNNVHFDELVLISPCRSWFWAKMDSSLIEFSVELVKKRFSTWFGPFWTRCGQAILLLSWPMGKLEQERRTPWAQEKKNSQTCVHTHEINSQCVDLMTFLFVKLLYYASGY